MRLLTGRSSSPPPSTNDVVSSSSFTFSPISIAAFGSIVVVEGYSDDQRSGSWVHAWTVTDGIITQVREYFNTSVTVTLLGSPPGSPAISSPAVTSPSRTCQSIWQSKLCDHKYMRFGSGLP
ncbi:senescence associated gene 20-like [Carica papaya]|uniref:senescence associated gene 20-like n=1 Tax=Carica papaya TaxID=3649 RepID=UPI000B8CE0F2|nr:senescence associated gene 20-like [Carica papaya]